MTYEDNSTDRVVSEHLPEQPSLDAHRAVDWSHYLGQARWQVDFTDEPFAGIEQVELHRDAALAGYAGAYPQPESVHGDDWDIASGAAGTDTEGTRTFDGTYGVQLLAERTHHGDGDGDFEWTDDGLEVAVLGDRLIVSRFREDGDAVLFSADTVTPDTVGEVRAQRLAEARGEHRAAEDAAAGDDINRQLDLAEDAADAARLNHDDDEDGWF